VRVKDNIIFGLGLKTQGQTFGGYDMAWTGAPV